MKRKSLLLIPALLGMFLSACGGDKTPSTPSGEPSEGGGQQTTQYAVHFANTTLSDVQIAEGGSLSKPNDPQKSNHMFAGWYLDSGLTQEASFPMTISSETTIYAKWYSYQEAFQKARNNTIGESIPGYEYDYTLQITASYMGVGLSGNTTGILNIMLPQQTLLSMTFTLILEHYSMTALSIQSKKAGICIRFLLMKTELLKNMLLITSEKIIVMTHPHLQKQSLTMMRANLKELRKLQLQTSIDLKLLSMLLQESR